MLQVKREDADRQRLATSTSSAYPTNGIHDFDPLGPRDGYTLMVAGTRSGKTSFLRLLLDTSEISPSASKEQLAAVAKFVHGCGGHTSHIRSASVDVILDAPSAGTSGQRTTLSLIDTPSLDFRDPDSAERIVSDILRYTESRFVEAIEDEHKLQNGGNMVHLCLYFLDPDHIVPPSAPVLPAPPVHRAHASAFSQQDVEPLVILEPPVVSKPLPANLPKSEIDTIHRLSSRVNVLPVIARADTLSNDRLAAVKMAVRKDLADAGIGFGIFDLTPDHLYNAFPSSHQHLLKADPSNNRAHHQNGSLSNGHSPPSSPVTPLLLRLPYALISPDVYSHNDGVPRMQPSRHEIINQYTPSLRNNSSRIAKGIYLRSYRWGSMDVLDPAHCDFVPLRSAVFHHMEALQKYTREYLFDKFRAENSRPVVSQHSLAHITSGNISSRNQLPPLSHTTTRPVLAIDTAPHLNQNRHHSLSLSHGSTLPDPHLQPPPPPQPLLPEPAPISRASKQRTKKIPVACNFCRSRKLKCDGGRPACSQCLKRSNPCDYMPQNRRRNYRQNRKDDDSESDSGEDRSGERDETSLSPETRSQPLSRRSSNVDKFKNDVLMSNSNHSSTTLPPMRPRSHEPPHDDLSSKSSSKPSGTSYGDSSSEGRTLFPDYELPQIATMSSMAGPPPDTSPLTPMSAPTLPAIRPASDQQAAQRKRAATVPGKAPRQPSTSGPKVVACNFCRARKTKCDGAHPACSSCARRSLQCNYAHDSSGPGGRKGRRTSTAKPPRDSPPSDSGMSQHHLHLNPPLPHKDGYMHPRHPHHEEMAEYHHPSHDLAHKRSVNELEINPGPLKKSRMDLDISPSVSSLA